MSGKAHRARRDTSEKEIIDVLKLRGFKVRQIAQKGLPDIMVWMPFQVDEFGGWPWLIECKTGKEELRETQQWHELGLRVIVLRTAEDAMRWNR